MCEIIKEVDWTQFDSFSGSDPVDFSRLLQQLCSGDANERESARSTLAQWPYELLVYVGRLGAVPLVVRCLTKIAGCANRKDNGPVLRLATRFARLASDYTHFVSWFSGDREALLTSIHKAYLQALPIYLMSLSDKDVEVRKAAAEGLELVPIIENNRPLFSELADSLVFQLNSEQDESVQQAILKALGRLAVSATLSIVIRYLIDSTPETRVQAAAAACRIGDPMPDNALQVLADAAVLGTEVDEQPSQLEVISQLDLVGNVKSVLDELGEKALSKVVDKWILRACHVSDRHIVDYVERMIMLAIPRHYDQRLIINFSFSPCQRKVLRYLAACPYYWNPETVPAPQSSLNQEEVGPIAPSHSYFLQMYGIPTTQEGLQEFLARID